LAEAPLTSQQLAGKPDEVFEESVQVQVVNLEVVVTNQEDERVTGLGRGDFVLRVDSEEMPIRYFSEVGAPRVDASPGDGSVRQEPVSFLVFVDDHVSLARNRDLTLERLRDELALLQPGDQMAIVAYDGRKISVLAPWTSEAATLDWALEAAIERPALGIRWVALGRSRNFIANWIGNATRRSVLAAGSSMRLLPRPSGRKVMLLVAGSWDPMELAAAKNFSPWCLSGPCVGNYVLSSLTDSANQLGYSIYAVDVEGRDVQQDWGREKRLQATLAMLAGQTGGKSLLNGERTRALSMAASDSRAYYSIGFEPQVVAVGSRHQVEVEVRGDGLEVRTRDSFVAVSQRRQRDIETFSTVLGDVDAMDSDLPVEVGEIERLSGRRMRVAVSVFAPSNEMIWLAADGLYQASFEVGLAAIDIYGNSVVESHQVTREQTAAARAGDAEHLVFDLLLKRRAHTLAIVVRDLQGDARLTAVVKVEPPRRSSERADAAPSDGQVTEDPSTG